MRLKWENGRLHKAFVVPYQKIKLFQFTLYKVIYDGYLIKYPFGSGIPWHRDKVPGRVHWRLNFILWNAIVGGEDEYRGEVFSFWRFRVFRSDEVQHRVTEVLAGTRYILSFGLAKRP